MQWVWHITKAVKGRGIERNYEITRDWCYCCWCRCGKTTGSIICSSSSNITELVEEGPIARNHDRSFLHSSHLPLSIHLSLHLSPASLKHPSIWAVPPYPHLPIHQTLLYFLHPSLSILYLLRSLHCSVSIIPSQVQDGCSRSLGPLKWSGLIGWMRHCVKLCCFILPASCCNFVNVFHQPINSTWAGARKQVQGGFYCLSPFRQEPIGSRECRQYSYSWRINALGPQSHSLNNSEIPWTSC